MFNCDNAGDSMLYLRSVCNVGTPRFHCLADFFTEPSRVQDEHFFNLYPVHSQRGEPELGNGFSRALLANVVTSFVKQ